MKTNLSNLRMIKMNQKAKAFLISLSSSIVLGLISTSASSQAIFNSTYSVTPPTTVRTDPPSVMLSMSRDHQYHFKAYNDYTDLDAGVVDGNGDIVDVDGNGNPNVETSYKHTFSYFGYFDSTKCYAYDGAVDRFNPVSRIQLAAIPAGISTANLGADQLEDGVITDIEVETIPATATDEAIPGGIEGLILARGVCSGNVWHGNFLNWMSMTRMDIVRRIFFGGFRSQDPDDPDGVTVLERAYLPSDAHSFTKYYNGRGGATINEVTPFTAPVNNGDDVDDFRQNSYTATSIDVY